jgi:hypothetical protein
MLELALENDITAFPPCGQVRGVAGWELSETPRDAKIVLFWYTEGIGTQDVGIVQEMELMGPMSHREAFIFDLPESPYSFTGTHITLKWAVELLINKGKEAKRIDIIMSPTGQIARLGRVEGPSLIEKHLSRTRM